MIDSGKPSPFMSRFGGLFTSCASREKRRRVSYSPECDFEYEDVLQSNFPLSIEISRKIPGGDSSTFVAPIPFDLCSKARKGSICSTRGARTLQKPRPLSSADNKSLWNIGISVLEEAYIDEALDVGTTTDRELVKNILDLFRLLDSEPQGSTFRDGVIASVSKELVELGDEKFLRTGTRRLSKTFECLTMGQR
eukprot:CAMPEP_0170196828 /NCGR_PEP_ID=MMETSP0040_2-20121228/64913_1 /TAXON_ID=641309 /ORGANISM="Lotharella oceanica, Strain CCMP622" /LENGTH=193 /DNA_ID=CAMNT_0010446365 /DNA_START=144 /DNA_END=721 /DNA_ORIENTATION=-